jgi:transposase
MRHPHRAGENLFVADAGQGIPLVKPPRGEIHDAALCLAGLGASHSPSAEGTWSPALPDWLGAHVRPFVARGGGPAVVVPDPLTAAVPRAHRSAPARHRPSADLADH